MANPAKLVLCDQRDDIRGAQPAPKGVITQVPTLLLPVRDPADNT